MAFYRDSIIAALVTLLLLDGAAVGARLYTRTRIVTRGFGWDDAALCLTYVRSTFCRRHILDGVSSDHIYLLCSAGLRARLCYVLDVDGIWIRR